MCERDFAETSTHTLQQHVDGKLAELTAHSQELVTLRTQRNQLKARVSQAETEQARMMTRLLPEHDLAEISRRLNSLIELASTSDDIQVARSTGARLEQRVVRLRRSVEDLQASTSENLKVSEELTRHAKNLSVPAARSDESPSELLARLPHEASEEVERLTAVADARQRASYEATQLSSALARESQAMQRLAELAEQKKVWDDRVAEAKRRQGIAKEVLEAATQARATIVQRVFTESLNDVWQAVFTRLAPDEGFIPSFGIPSATRKTFDIKLETTHRSGAASGPPQMMLSAGNLNTAALSLFLALHLAIDPLVPCLVFDDPVQAMDEVHVAQFAALIRLLSKRNGRQVVIAVHDRELFDYLALELSPAFENDELITIELGARALDEDGGIVRHGWAPDAAIAS